MRSIGDSLGVSCGALTLSLSRGARKILLYLLSFGYKNDVCSGSLSPWERDGVRAPTGASTIQRVPKRATYYVLVFYVVLTGLMAVEANRYTGPAPCAVLCRPLRGYAAVGHKSVTEPPTPLYRFTVSKAFFPLKTTVRRAPGTRCLGNRGHCGRASRPD